MSNFLKWATLVVSVMMVPACRNIDVTNLTDVDLTDGDGVSDVGQVVSVRVVPDGATRTVGDTLRLRAICLNRFGGEVECSVDWQSGTGALVVSENGLLTFAHVGEGEVCAIFEFDSVRIKGCGQYTSRAVVPVTPPDTTTTTPAHCNVSLSGGTSPLDSLVMAKGQTADLTANCSGTFAPVWGTSNSSALLILSTDGMYTDTTGTTYRVGFHAKVSAIWPGAGELRLRSSINSDTTTLALLRFVVH